MKRTILCIMILFNLFGWLGLKAANVNVEHVHPLNWWAGMNNPELQILLHGKGIGGYDVELKDANGVAMQRVVKTENKNYIIYYIIIRLNYQHIAI